MKNPNIGLIGRHDDPEVELLKRRVEDLGATATVVDFWHFPKFAKAWMVGDTMVYDDVELTALDAFYLRQLTYFSPLPEKEFTKEEWVEYYGKFNDRITDEREILALKESIIQTLSCLKPVVNPYAVAFYHKLKPFQYRRLAAEGLPVPEFSAGNEFFELEGFLRGTAAVVKPLAGGFVNTYSVGDLRRQRDDLRKRPVLLQKKIKGRMLRSFVLGSRLLGTCEMVHKADDADSRRNVEAIRAFDLSEDHAEIPVKACRALGMIFSGVDLMLEEGSDRLYVLECNPAPFFRNFEAQTGLPLSHELARYLTEEAAL